LTVNRVSDGRQRRGGRNRRQAIARRHAQVATSGIFG